MLGNKNNDNNKDNNEQKRKKIRQLSIEISDAKFDRNPLS